MTALDWLREVPIAHRGLHGRGVPENSLAAIRAAVDAGVGVEVDVHPLADDQVAVFHDPLLERMCGVRGAIADETAASLVRLRLADGDEYVPTLPQVLDAVGGRVPILVEMKWRPGIGPGEVARRVARDLAGYEGPAAVMSFDPRAVAWFRKHAPGIVRGLLGASPRVPGVRAEAAASGVSRRHLLAVEYLLGAPLCRPHFVGYDLRALPHPAVSLARRLGRPVLAGIAVTPDERALAARHGDAVCFENEPV